MKLTNFSRIENAVDINLLQNTKVVAVGAGGAYCLYDSLARSAIGKLTVLDFDEVEEVNIVRQGYETNQIGMKKVDALGEHLLKVNSGVKYQGITKNFLDMDQTELDNIFGEADIFLFLTDSFDAQTFGNKLAIKYQTPAIWAGYYEKSQCAEIAFYIPNITPGCFRCAVSPRYKIQAESETEIKASSNSNTIFHSQLLDSYIGMLLMAILHNKTKGFEFSNWFGDYWDRSFLQIKIHPKYGIEKGSLFQRIFEPSAQSTFSLNSIWQKVEQELPPKYAPCPDCATKK